MTKTDCRLYQHVSKNSSSLNQNITNAFPSMPRAHSIRFANYEQPSIAKFKYIVLTDLNNHEQSFHVRCTIMI